MDLSSRRAAPRGVDRPDRARARAAAQQALAICASADRLALEAAEAAVNDDTRLLVLLEQRDEMLQDLSEHLVTLKHARPTADSPLLAHSALMLDEADALIADVCQAVDQSQRITMELLGKLARRSEELRTELDAVQRAGSAGLVYGTGAGASAAVDIRR